MFSTLYHFVVEVVDVDDYVRVLYNLIGVSKGKGVTSKYNYVVLDNGNIIVVVSWLIRGIMLLLMLNVLFEVKEADELELID